MIRTRERKIYVYIFAVSLLLAFVFGAISLYSRVIVEVKADKIITGTVKILEKYETAAVNEADLKIINENYKAAYLLVRKPQFFASYKNFDDQAFAIKKIIQQYDQIVANNGSFEADSFIYINYLLNRRKAGSYLGLYTAVVFFGIAVISGLAVLLTKVKD